MCVPCEKYHAFLYIFPLFRINDFLMGIIAYHMYKKINISRWKNVMELISIIFLIVLTAYYEHIPKPYNYDVIFWIPVVFLIFVFSKMNGVGTQILESKLFQYLGEISFSLFMTHWFALYFMKKYLLFTEYSVMSSCCIYLVVSLILAIIIHHIGEKPLLNYFLTKQYSKK